MASKFFENLSSSTLFNFTTKWAYLADNLRNGIHAQTIFEDLPFGCGYAVPMASFCDIPLGMVKQHLHWYGYFGLGVSRKYASKSGVLPVWYVDGENKVAKELFDIARMNPTENPDIMRLLSYFKSLSGIQQNLNGEERKKKFYDEREWRFVPNSELPIIYKASQWRNPKVKKISETRMPLPIDAIEYIIIESSKDISNLLRVFEEVAKNEGQYDILVSKILTTKQIIRDF